jgi:hypothetical protein
MVHVVECLPSKDEALSSNPAPQKKKKRNFKIKRVRERIFVVLEITSPF